MSSRQDLKDFPNVEAKLQRPAKQSAFDKSKAEAEAKRIRDAAEAKAALVEFEKEFEGPAEESSGNGFQSRDSTGFNHGPGRLTGQPPSGPAASRRHFGFSGLKDGPGRLGPVPSAFGKKRSFQEISSQQPKGVDKAQSASEGKAHGMPISNLFNSLSDDDDVPTRTGDRAREKAIAKPTLKMNNLPPGISQAAIKALLPTGLVIDGIKIQGTTLAGSERRSNTAIVTLSQETPVTDIEAAVSLLQNKYLGYGYYLSLHRHLSSAVVDAPSLTSTKFSSINKPFGAKPSEVAGESRVNPMQFSHRGYAPPSSYSNSHVDRSSILSVPVEYPEDIGMVQLIHKVIQGVIEHGPSFESLLCSRSDVRKEEQWAWIWDARSTGGIWYRWKLWEIVHGSKDARQSYVPLFEDASAWKKPEKRLPFEYTTERRQIISDPAYDASEDEQSDEDHEGQREEKGRAFLNPLRKAKLTHFLARLPPTHLKVRKGDVARITAFAMSHATRGVDEIVDMIVSNVERPYCVSAANARRKQERKDLSDKGNEEQQGVEAADTSAGCLVGLYVIHDILSTSAINSAPKAWRYRQLFETSLRDRRVFEKLGLMPEKLGWGRLRAEKWKRSIQLILNQWKAADLFSIETQETFTKTFENPPSRAAEVKTEGGFKKSKWKSLEKTSASENQPGGYRVKQEEQMRRLSSEDGNAGEPIGEEEIMGEPIGADEIMGEPIDEDEIMGEPITDEFITGVPIDDVEIHGDGLGSQSGTGLPVTGDAVPDNDAPKGRVQPKKRMRAVDMFASSDEDGN